jgi:hypothetical protein
MHGVVRGYSIGRILIIAMLAFLFTFSGVVEISLASLLRRHQRRASPTRLFSPTSVWNAPVPAGARLDRKSAAMVRSLNNFVTASEHAGNGPWIDTTDYSSTMYTVPAHQPTVPVIMDYTSSYLPGAMAAVPIPRGAFPSAGSDAQMTVYQRSSNTLWEMFDMRQSLNPPPFLSAKVSTGGQFPAGTYSYAVTALTSHGQTTQGPVQTYRVPAGGKVALLWNGPIGSSGYRVYRGTNPQHLRLIATQAGYASNSRTDDGSAQLSAIAPPTTGTAATPGHWHAQWGGRMIDVSSNPGYYYDIPDPKGGYLEYDNWGATASSLPIAAGLITLADLASGRINHAIALMVPKAKASVAYCPALRTDGYDTSPNAIPEGAHFRLNPRLDLSKLQMPPITRMIAKAAQKYGLIVNDQTGVTAGFRAEDPTPLMREGHPDPYVKYFTDPETGKYEMPSQFLTSFPWSHLQLLVPPHCL